MAQWGQGQQGFQYPMQTGFQQPNQQFQQNQQFQPQNPQFQPQNPTFQQQGPQFQQGGLGIPNGGPLLSQPTGFQAQRQPGFQQPQQTGFQGGSGFLQSQPTGFPGGNFQQQNRPAPPPVPPIPSRFQQPGQQPSFLNMPPPQPSRLMNASPGFGGGGLLPQQTGFPGNSPAPLVPQMTGFVDPRLQMMSQTFMPMNTSAPFGAGGVPQLPPQQQNLVQSIQQHNEAQRGSSGQQLPWALTKAEKKNYDKIFRSWDAQGTGFISGATALDVFGASGLPKDDLARIWTLADINDRGKLNIAEFHVAMGLIYRRLNGMPVPDQLPQELVPPSVADLDSTVDRVKELLANDTRSGSGNKHSFTSKPPTTEGRRDAANYKHSDTEPIGGYYKPANRHVNRSAVRSREDEDSPSADLSDMKRQLESTAHMLDRAAEESANRTREDEELDQEMEDLKYRVKRVKDDLDYVARGPKTAAKEEERRRLERDLLSLLHERIPEVERKIKARDERKEREKRQWARDRDRANDRFGRYDRYRDDDYSSRRDDDRDRDRPYSRGDTLDRPYSRGGDRPYSRGGDDRDRPYSRGADDRDRPYSRGGDDRDRPYSRGADDRDRPYSRGAYDDRGGSYRDGDRSRDDRDRRDGAYDRAPAARSPPPVPAAAPASAIRDPPAAPAPPKSTPSPSVKNMTAAERQAFAKAEAQRRIQARMAALGVTVPSSSTDVDTSVEDRLQQEKKEAEEKARAAELQAEERERARKERLANEKALQEEKAAPPPQPPAPTPTSTYTAPPPAPAPKAAPTPKVAPPPPKPRVAPAPPVRKGAAPRPPVAAAAPVAPPAPAPPKEPEVDPEEEEWRAREAKLRKQKEERLARMRQLEQEEEEAARLEQERAARVEAMKARAAKPPTPPPAAPVAPPAPPAPPAPTRVEADRKPAPPPNFSTPAVSPGNKSSTNPFSKMLDKESTSSPVSPPTANGNGNTSPNPWANIAPVSTPPSFTPVRASSIPPPSKSPAPSSAKTSYQTAPSTTDDDWDDIKEKDDDDDSSDDEITRSRSVRTNIAQQLFGGMLPRPTSAAASAPTSSPSTPAPGGADSGFGGPPPPPPPPGPPPPPAVKAAPVVVASGPADVNALLLSIQGGKKLRATKTVDRSAPPVSGRVLGDTAPPAHINNAPRPASPPAPSPPPAQEYIPPETTPMSHDDGNRSSNRQSVAWLADRAADVGSIPEDIHRLPSTAEEEEEVYVPPAPAPAETSIPKIMVDEPTPEPMSDLMADIDKSTQLKVRSLYAFEGDGPEDLSFGENLIINANPSKSGGDWWYGSVVSTGKSGLFPKTYVEVVKPKKAKAIYSYTGNNADELPISEGETLSIIDTSEEEWWKTERDGVVFIVPAAYLELVEDREVNVKPSLAVNSVPQVGNVPTTESTANQSNSTYDRAESDSDDSDSDSDSDSDYLSFDESDNEETATATTKDKEARERERQLVLEAAGLIVNRDVGPPPVRNRSVKRRPAPAAPKRSPSFYKDLPALPQSEPEPDVEPISHEARLDDAFARYEQFKNAQGNLNRLSVVSTDSGTNLPSSPATTVSSMSPAQGQRESEGRYSHFLHFLTGSKSSSTEGERRSASTLNISAPIMNVSTSQGTPQDGPSRSNSPSFGMLLDLDGSLLYQSWASLVDKDALDGIPPSERKRQEAFVSSLEERQKDCRLYVDKIGDILLSHVPNMGVYMEYCVNQSTAIKVLQSLRDSNPELASHLQILHYTEVGEEHDGIAVARDMTEKLLDHINEAIRDQEGYETLKKISQNLWIGQGRLDLTAPTRFMGPRRLLRQGVLIKAKSGKKLHGFLCSDILVLLDESMKNLYRMPIPLAHAQVKEGGKGMCYPSQETFNGCRKLAMRRDALDTLKTEPREESAADDHAAQAQVTLPSFSMLRLLV
ncbi:Actin cytoskeleton-regulatory complex protein pan1 [Psilocybe cubensis]|uniref:Actin cytoskeleton-regulatory complex protein pan1 n=1 Tax=Psilocybe cubensis TaxID=181762 RepID=A0ACB8H6A8_PSICU|nr:Actin cytoskeleton-regulatory complex protein pan1 [Psilocybe cubensis]KAH9483528.1 Actin cytoskeleton-regulatory complex protein pan1 [Psilocybe cubensis]